MFKKYILPIVLLILVIVFVLVFATGNKANNESATPTPTSENQNVLAHMEKQGVLIDVLKEGTGDESKSGDTVTVDYVGTLQDGMKFDSSIDRGTPFSFKLGAGEVIEGWDIGVDGMKVGEKRKLTITPEKGYGSYAIGSIPANSTLVFEVEMLQID